MVGLVNIGHRWDASNHLRTKTLLKKELSRRHILHGFGSIYLSEREKKKLSELNENKR